MNIGIYTKTEIFTSTVSDFAPGAFYLEVYIIGFFIEKKTDLEISGVLGFQANSEELV